MRPRSALAWYVGLGAVGYAGWQLFRSGLAVGVPIIPASQTASLAFLGLFAAFASGALALVTLVPAAFEARRGWLWRTAAFLPATVAAFVVEQLEEALVPGGAEAQLSTAGLVGLLTLAACGWLVFRAEGRQRRWMAIGILPAAGLAAVSVLTRYGVAHVAALALVVLVAIGLALAWLRPLPTEAAEARNPATPSWPS